MCVRDSGCPQKTSLEDLDDECVSLPRPREESQFIFHKSCRQSKTMILCSEVYKACKDSFSNFKHINHNSKSMF